MATVIGESGRYVSDELSRKRRKLLAFILSIVAILSFVAGMLFASGFEINLISKDTKLIISISAFLCLIVIDRWSNRQIRFLERERDNQSRGLAGEQLISNSLQNLPNDYYVINNLSTSSGDIDHIVIGPTGVFAIDTKSWRGVISGNGSGDILLNGEIKNLKPFVGRMMGVRQKVQAHIPNFEHRFKALYVFTAARVEARWGTTGNVFCLTDDQLHSFITDDKFGKKLAVHEIESIAGVLRGFAHMDSDFNRRA